MLYNYQDSRLESIENQLSEVQSTNDKLSELVNKVELQLCDNRKSLENMMNDHPSGKNEFLPKPASLYLKTLSLKLPITLLPSKKRNRSAS